MYFGILLYIYPSPTEIEVHQRLTVSKECQRNDL
jgi:hypothetical protein